MQAVLRGWGFLIISVFIFSESFSTKNILLLNSYHVGYSWTDEIVNGVRETVNVRDDIGLYIEFLDTKRFKNELNYAEFRKFLFEKYKNIPFDAIITSDNDALDFVLNNRINQIWNIPVVFCGISNYLDYDIKNKNIWGVIESDDWSLILKTLINAYKGDVEKFYFIVENSITGQIRKKELDSAIGKLPFKTPVEYIENYSFNSLIDIIDSISGKSILLFQGIGMDSYGNPIEPEKLSIALVQHAKIPVFAGYIDAIGQGALGGWIRPGKMQGSESAKIALELIDKINPDSINKITFPAGQLIFDYNQINKYNLEIEDFPQEAVFINKPVSILITYKKEVYSTLFFIALLFIVIILLFINILKRQKAERYISESEKRFREFAEMLPQTVFECDLDGNLIFVNNYGLESLGYSKEEFKKGMNIFQVFLPDDHDKIRKNIERIIKNDHFSHSNVYHAVRKDHSVFPFEVHSSLILEGGKAKGLRAIGINVTKQKNFEEELIVARKKAEESDKLKSTFLANMSHEIRTPLNSIVGFSYLLAERSLNEEEIKKMAYFIKASSDHLLMLINDIIDISKIEAGQLSIHLNQFDVNEMICEILQFIEKEKSITDKNHIDINFNNPDIKKITTINSDNLRVKQILLNLMNNALKFTEKGSIDLGYKFKDSAIVFQIKDTGIGISAELKARIFERFAKDYSTKGKIYPGFGLGLSISKQLTDLLGGKLWFEDNPAGGTVFYLSLPVNQDILKKL